MRSRERLLTVADSGGFPEVADAVARAAVFTAQHLGVRQIVAYSRSGFTARLIARYRPPVPILVLTPNKRVACQMQLLWGVMPLLVTEQTSADGEIILLVENYLKSARLVRPGERLIVLMGGSASDRPKTNLMQIHQVRR